MISTHPVYYPLYQDTDKPIILITGGRGSGKSFAVSTFLERLSFEVKHYTNDEGEREKVVHNILFSRYTMTSAELSVIPEFMEKVEADGTGAYFHSTKQDVVNIQTGSKIMFRGIKTSSGNQTAKLKSIHGITTFVCDEAEEWQSEREFMTIMLSIRQKGIQNRIVIVMNPTDKHHFIYRNYIEQPHRLEYLDGVPVQISTHPSVLHIHTTYLDNKEHLGEEFIKEVERIKETNPQQYAHTIMGRWADEAEGVIFDNYDIVDEFPRWAKHEAIGLDFGYSCFRGDTLITTRRGNIPIRDIVAGDEVLTRQGYRKVLKKHNNGIKEVVGRTIKVGNIAININATDNHNFNSNGKWKKYGELTNGDRLFVLSSSTDTNTVDTPKENTPTITTTSGKKTGSATKKCCTTQFGNIIGAIYQRVKSFITSTSTRSTTTFPTLWRLHRANTDGYTEKSCPSTIAENTDIQKTTGTSGEKSRWKSCKARQECADIAGQHLSPQTPTSVSVPRNATTDGNTQHQNTMLCSHANGAERSSTATNISNQNAVPTDVRISSQAICEIKEFSREYAEVYDLTIEGVHEYFANGILVHNCDPTAAVRCGIVGDVLYLDELFYNTGMLSSDIVRELKAKGNGLKVIADSADPRLIQEIANSGVLIYPVQKFPGSIVAGIDKMKTMRLHVTSRSKNIITELQNYIWDKDKDGQLINQPVDAFNHCFAGNTMVLTDKGNRRIDTLVAGDMVLTSQGYKRVTKFFDNGNKKVISALLCYRGGEVEITATPDHKIKTAQGWIKLENLKKGMTIFLAKSSTEKNTDYIKASGISHAAQGGCMSSCGNTITGKSPKASTSTIKTRTHRTTTYQTLNLLRGRSTYTYTHKKNLPERDQLRKCASGWNTRANTPINGTAATRVAGGTANTPKSKISSRGSLFVNNAVNHISQDRQGKIGFARINARQLGDGNKDLTTKHASVNIAARSSNTTNISSETTAFRRTAYTESVPQVRKNDAPPCREKVMGVSLQQIKILNERTEHVYDIEVEQAHEFFANGVLVHNCMDASRYYVLGELLGHVMITQPIRGDLPIF